MAGNPITARLSRVDNSSPWGFRMQGGKDFSAPLTVNRVTPGTISANSGLQSGDVITEINGRDATGMKHKEAQDAIIGAGNNLTVILRRGGSYPIAAYSSPTPPPATAPAPNVYTPPPPPQQQPAKPQSFNSPSALYGGMQKMSLQSEPAGSSQSARYEEPGGNGEPLYKGYTNPEVQSRSFNALKGVIDQGQDPASYNKQAPWQSETVNVAADAPAKMAPSHAWRMVQEEEGRDPADLSAANSAQSKTYDPKPAPEVISAGSFTQKSTPAPPPAISSRPGVWTPGGGGGGPAASAPSKPWASQSASGSMDSPQAGGGAPPKPVRGSATFSQAVVDPTKVPVCNQCHIAIRGPFILALSKTWCPQHFVCAQCDCQLVNKGFVELNGKVYCEKDYETYFAPTCNRCKTAIVGETVNALDKSWHPQCFVCSECGVPIKSGSFHVENGMPYCDKDWSQLFQTKCSGCDFAVEPGDKWVEALGRNWHAECFNCTVCHTNLEGKPFVPQGGKPYCKTHARMGY